MVNYQDHDPIEQAVDDHRLGYAYDLLRSDTDEGHKRGADLLAQITYEYVLWPNELNTTLEIYSNRLHGERQQ